MTLTMAAKVELQLQPVLKTIVYAALAGEFLRNTGMTDDDQLNAVQQAVAEGLAERIIVSARRPDGGVDTFTLKMTPARPRRNPQPRPASGQEHAGNRGCHARRRRQERVRSI